MNGKPMAVVLGHVGCKQVRDELGECWSLCVGGVAWLWSGPFWFENLTSLLSKDNFVLPVLLDNLEAIPPPEKSCLVLFIHRVVHCKESISVR